MRIHKLIASQVFTLTILFSLHTPAMAKVETHECSSDSSAKICQTQRTPKKNNKHSGTSSTGDNIVTENNNSGSQSQNSDTYTSKAPNGLTMVYSKTDPTLNACITKDGRVGHVNYANRFVRDAVYLLTTVSESAPHQKFVSPTMLAPSPVPTTPALPAPPTKKSWRKSAMLQSP